MNPISNTTAKFDDNFLPYLPLYFRIISTLVYMTVGMVGIVGNLMVIIVVLRTKNMTTPTNCYLVSLAVADCLFFCSTGFVEISHIHTPYEGYVFGRVFCSLLSYMSYLSINGSAFSIIAFTVERYIGICHPFTARTLCTVKRACLIIVLLWTFSMIYNSPWLALTTTIEKIHVNIIHVVERNENIEVQGQPYYVCGFKLDRNSTAYKTMFVGDFVMFYIVPMALFFVLYGKMARVLTYRPMSQYFEKRSIPKIVRDDTLRKSKSLAKLHIKSGIGGTKKEHGLCVSNDDDYDDKPRACSAPNSKIAAPNSKISTVEKSEIRATLTSQQSKPLAVQKILNDPNYLKAKNKELELVTNSESKFLENRDRRVEFDSIKSSSLETKESASTSNSRGILPAANFDRARKISHVSKNRKQVVKMLGVIVLVFGVGWLPYRLLLAYNSFASKPWINDKYIFFAKSMIFVNCAINPILYNLMSKKFRAAFRNLLPKCCRKSDNN